MRVLTIAGLMAGVSACHSKPITDHYYMVAKQVQQSPETKLSLTVVHKFEKESWCKDEAKFYTKHGFQAECPFNARNYDPMLNGEPVGKWYLLQRIDKSMSLAIMFEFDPPLPEKVVLAQLKQIAPHVVKLAAVHRVPAESLIFSPEGDVRFQEKFSGHEPPKK